MNWDSAEIGLIRYPEACPGCDSDYDSRTHNERWCMDCRPANGSTDRPPRGGCDDRAARQLGDHAYMGSGGSAVEPESQREAGRLWGAPEDLTC